MHPQRISRKSQRQRLHIGLIAINGQDRCLPRVFEIFVGEREVKEPSRADVGQVPDLGFSGPHRHLRIELAVNTFLPAGHEAVACPQSRDLTVLDVDL